MYEIKAHIHIYLVLVAAILVAVGGILSIWRMKGVEREIAAIRRNYDQVTNDHKIIVVNQKIIIQQNEQLIREHAQIIEHLLTQEREPPRRHL